MKREILAETPPYLRRARSEGEPVLGVGRIYPLDPSQLRVAAFRVPDHWPRAWALDPGWKMTAALFAAWEPEGDVMYVMNEYARGRAPSLIHAQAIKARGGDWVPGLIDPASAGVNMRDGGTLIEEYRGHGLNVEPSENAVLAGIERVYGRMETGRLRLFPGLERFEREMGSYVWKKDPHGQGMNKPLKKNDHLMDALRYLELSGLRVAVSRARFESRRAGMMGIRGDSSLSTRGGY